MSCKRAALLALLLAGNVGAGNPPPELAAGDAALAQHQLDTATQFYRAALASAPQNYEATWKLCRALLDKGTLTRQRTDQKALFTEAERLARRAVELEPADSQGHTFLAIAVGKLALFEGGKRKVELSKEIKTLADRALALNPRDDVAHHVLGVWHREMVQLNFVLRGVAEMLYGKFPAASLAASATHLRQATQLAPTAVAHRVELGLTLLAAGQRDEARQVLRAAAAMPQTWVTDESYRAKAKQAL